MPNIVLVGIPGSGKTTVGQLLAKKLNINFFDSDQVIEERIGKSVAEIFTEDGEPTFRQLESATIQELLQAQNSVISLGGGALGNDETRTLVKNERVIWLTAGLAQTVARIGLNRNRPLLLGNVRGQLSSLMEAREPLYREVATHTIDTTHLLPEQVVEEIAQLLETNEDTQ